MVVLGFRTMCQLQPCLLKMASCTTKCNCVYVYVVNVIVMLWWNVFWMNEVLHLSTESKVQQGGWGGWWAYNVQCWQTGACVRLGLGKIFMEAFFARQGLMISACSRNLVNVVMF